MGLYIYCAIVCTRYLENKRQNNDYWKNGLRFITAVAILAFGWTQKVRMDVFFWESNNTQKVKLYSQPNKYDYLSKPVKHNIDIYFILGEALSKSQTSLYGYKRKTTPYLDSIKNKPYFKYYRDAISAGEHTEVSYERMFSRAYDSDSEMFFTSPNLFEEIKHSGYRTVWITYRKMEKQIVYKAITDGNDEVYDSKVNFNDLKMIPFLKKSLKDTPTFYTIQMHGSHKPYGAGLEDWQVKYSKTKTGDRKQDDINVYDDTALAMDDFVKRIHKIAENHKAKTNRPYTIIYVADHGQNMYHEPDTDWVSYSASYEKHPNGMRVPYFYINANNLPCANTLPDVNTPELRLNDFFFVMLKSICAVK